MNAVQVVGCLRRNINVALMDGVKVISYSTAWVGEPAGLGLEDWTVGRYVQALLTSGWNTID